MVDLILVLLGLLLSLSVLAKGPDLAHQQGYLGEKDLVGYAERYYPLVKQDFYLGKISFQDENFLHDYFNHYIFPQEKDFTHFLRSELAAGMTCPNEKLSQHFKDIRYAYRLMTMSYLLESAWHLRLVSQQLGLKNACGFELDSWLETCKPQESEMIKLLGSLKKFKLSYEERLPSNYKAEAWWKEYLSGKGTLPSHWLLSTPKLNSQVELPQRLKTICQQDQSLLTLICSEKDELFGLSENRDAYSLLSSSNIINTFNHEGEAVGCLRRFSEVLAHREARYPILKNLFPPIRSYLQEKHGERFLQGRIFFFGSNKEFELKGLTDIHVDEKPIPIPSAPKPEPGPIQEPAQPEPTATVAVKPQPKAPAKPVAVSKKEVNEIRHKVKSAFLQAAELRASQNSQRVEVDMLKLKYDYVFSLNMITTLSERLKVFMTREALQEMKERDELGSLATPVPLMFLKFMVDMQEHQGLWNMVQILGNKFWVTNEIDAEFRPAPQYIELVNDDSTGRQWQFYVLRPN